MVVPVGAYFFWLVNYAIVNFVIAKGNIKSNDYGTLYKLFGDYEWVGNLAKSLKTQYSPPIFMCFHFLLFFVCHLGGMIAYHSFWFNTFIVLLYSYISLWNGACFYMDYFAKKYDKLLKEYEEQYKETS